MIDRIVLLTIFLYITLNLKKIENFIDGGYKFEAFTAKKDKKQSPTLQTTPGAIKWRILYTLAKSFAVVVSMIFLVDRHDMIGKPANIGPEDNPVLEADTWNGGIITSADLAPKDAALTETDYHPKQTEGLGIWGWIYGTKVDHYFLAAPTTSILPIEGQTFKAWIRDQFVPILSILWFFGLIGMISIAWNGELSSLWWQRLLWMETITNEVVTVIIIYVILKFAQKDVSKGAKDMAEKIYNEINKDDDEFKKQMAQASRRKKGVAAAMKDRQPLQARLEEGWKNTQRRADEFSAAAKKAYNERTNHSKPPPEQPSAPPLVRERAASQQNQELPATPAEQEKHVARVESPPSPPASIPLPTGASPLSI